MIAKTCLFVSAFVLAFGAINAAAVPPGHSMIVDSCHGPVIFSTATPPDLEVAIGESGFSLSQEYKEQGVFVRSFVFDEPGFLGYWMHGWTQQGRCKVYVGNYDPNLENQFCQEAMRMVPPELAIVLSGTCGQP